MSNTAERRSRYGPLLDRLKIIALGLALGLSARLIVRVWPAITSAKDQPTQSAPLQSKQNTESAAD